MLYQLSYRRLATCSGQVASGHRKVHLVCDACLYVENSRRHVRARRCPSTSRTHEQGTHGHFRHRSRCTAIFTTCQQRLFSLVGRAPAQQAGGRGFESHRRLLGDPAADMSVAAESQRGIRWGRRRMRPTPWRYRRWPQRPTPDHCREMTCPQTCVSQGHAGFPPRQARLRTVVSINVDFCDDRHMAAWSSGMILA